LAPAYEGAVRLMADEGFPARVHLIGHLVRDIVNRLPYVLDKGLKNERMDYQKHVIKIEKAWPLAENMFDVTTPLPSGEQVPIPANVAKQINDLVKEHRANTRRPRQPELLFQFFARSDRTAKASVRTIREFERMRDWFTERTHLRDEAPPPVDKAELDRWFDAFETILHSFVGNFFTLSGELDACLKIVKPTDDQVDAVAPKLGSPPHEWYFFDRLDSPHWIDPLAKRGFFKHPPLAKRLDGGRAGAISWSESRYLARMAQQAPREVAEIFAKIETDNFLIVRDLQKAALTMPPEMAALLTAAVCRASEAGLADFKDASDFCAKLASASHTDAAMKLANSLFTIRKPADREDSPYRNARWYMEGLQKVSPILTSANPRDFLPKLCGWLRAAVQDNKPWNEVLDFSTVWRPAIEEHEQNSGYDFAAQLVSIVRQSFEKALSSKGVSLAGAMEILQREHFLIFKRLVVHLINCFADQDPVLARRTMMDRSLFEDSNYKHEYAMLVGRRFPMLDASERGTWFEWVEAGRELREIKKWIKIATGKEATDDDVAQEKRYWQFQRYYWVRDHLQGKRKVFYEQMLAAHGQPEFADLNSRHGTAGGSESPIAIEELQKLSFSDAVNRVATWRPDKPRFFGGDLQGLTGALRGYIATNSELFSKDASQLKERPFIFVDTFLEQMSAAVQDGKTIDIAAVLGLCEWVLDQPVVISSSPSDAPRNATEAYQQWTRDAVSRFIETLCKARVNGRPRFPLDETRQRLAHALKKLMNEPVESNIIEQEPVQNLRVLDYLDHAINSSRGKAIDALFEYAQWIADHGRASEANQESAHRGLDSMPEVKEMLEWQINHASFAASALFGAKIGNLYGIDKAWLESNASKIFDLPEIEGNPTGACGWVAWNAFLVWAQPHIEFYRLLRAQFAYAVVESSSIKPSGRSQHEPVYRLGEHLMVLYGRGQLSLDDDGQLIRRFFTTTDPEIRIRSMEFVGGSLTREAPIGAAVITRFQDLWDFYWPEFGRHDMHLRTRNRVGSWFESNEFPNDWYLSRLENFVKTARSAELDRSVIERLAEIAPASIDRVTALLDQLLPGAEESWRLWDWGEPAKTILRIALQADQPVRELARRIIDRLGRLGLIDFGKLLRPQTSGSQ